MFYKLDYPYETQNDQAKEAWVDPDVKTWERIEPPIVCPVDPEHRKRIRKLDITMHVVLPNREPEDFIGLAGEGLLLQDHVADLFREHQITSFHVEPVVARFEKKDNSRKPPRLWLLRPVGWGGVAPPESGVRILVNCPGCGYLKYHSYEDPSKFIDPQQWDGSDLFFVWPFPAFIFATDRVADLMQNHGLRGAVVRDYVTALTERQLPDLPDHLRTCSPGRLRHWLPEPRAREIGEPLGIY